MHARSEHRDWCTHYASLQCQSPLFGHLHAMKFMGVVIPRVPVLPDYFAHMSPHEPGPADFFKHHHLEKRPYADGWRGTKRATHSAVVRGAARDFLVAPLTVAFDYVHPVRVGALRMRSSQRCLTPRPCVCAPLQTSLWLIPRRRLPHGPLLSSLWPTLPPMTTPVPMLPSPASRTPPR